jgi:acetyl esterase/lipase
LKGYTEGLKLDTLLWYHQDTQILKEKLNMRLKKTSLFLVLLVPVLLVIINCRGNGAQAVLYENVPYGAHARQILDLRYPQAPNTIKEPVTAVLLIHGGYWTEGVKEQYPADDYFAKLPGLAGVVTATMDYRTLFSTPTAYCDEMLEDVGSAIQFIKDESARLGVTIDKIVLAGHSAGGHLALLYSYRYHDQSAIPIALVAGIAGPSDLLDPVMYTPGLTGFVFSIGVSYVTHLNTVTQHDIDGYYQAFAALAEDPPNVDPFMALYDAVTINFLKDPNSLSDNEAAVELVNPAFYVTPAVPPTVFFHGELDDVVLASNSRRLEEKLKAAGVPVTYHEYIGENHLFTNADTTRADILAKLSEYIVALE